MWFTKGNSGFRGWFAAIKTNGTLNTGLAASSFTVTTRNPLDTTSSISTVKESGKLGLYRFDISSSFFLAHGPGEYGVVVEISAGGNSDVLSQVLKVSNNDFDSLASGSITFSSSTLNQIVSGTTNYVWDTSMTTHNLSGSAGALLRSASQGPTPTIDYSTIADYVWDEQLFGHQTSGSSGFILSQLSGSMGVITTDVSFIKSIEGGRWKIVSDQMVFYKDDNVTEVARFDLFDETGNPSMDAVFERKRV